jgi:hypothetical protein
MSIPSETDVSLGWVLTMCGICLLGLLAFGSGLDHMGVFDPPTQLDRIEQNQILILEKLDGSK